MAETIVMIHGMWGGPWYWESYAAYFEKAGYRCVTPTLRYHDIHPGDEPDSRLGTMSLVDYADDLEKLIRRLDGPVVLMGHSMGGLLAQILASRGLADAAVLLAPASPYGILALTPSVVRSFWSIMITWGFWKKPVRPTFKEASYSSLGVLAADKRTEVFDKFVYESGRAVFEIGMWYFDPGNASKVDESKITCPVLILTGTADKITPVSVVRKIAKKYKGTTAYRELENHGHWLVGEPGWEEIAGYASDWLDDVFGADRTAVADRVEQRKYKRTQQHALIAFWSTETDDHYRGELGNYSQGGLRFTSEIEVDPGTTINIQWVDSIPGEIGSIANDICCAEVIWQIQAEDKCSYDIGVRFS